MPGSSKGSPDPGPPADRRRRSASIRSPSGWSRQGLVDPAALVGGGKAAAARQAGAPGTGPFAEITRHNFAQVPREWEIADQLVVGVDEILAELQRPDYRTEGGAGIEDGIDDVDA